MNLVRHFLAVSLRKLGAEEGEFCVKCHDVCSFLEFKLRLLRVEIASDLGYGVCPCCVDLNNLMAGSKYSSYIIMRNYGVIVS
jgi:hypothetical protein